MGYITDGIALEVTADALVKLGELLAPKFKFENCGNSTELFMEAGISGGGPKLCT